jgi:predicted DsbA family dithiol-disulfide isomerase
MSREQYLTAKSGSPEAYKNIVQRVTAAAVGEGLVYASDRINRQPNTRDPHCLIRWAEAIGKAPEMKQRLMDLYFADGADLSNTEVLVQAATDVELDPAQVRSDLASDKDIAEVELDVQMAKDAGIQGVPMFIFGDKFADSKLLRSSVDPHYDCADRGF